MKKHKITICITDKEKKEVLDQMDIDVPNIFNTYDTCDPCEEQTGCENCIVRVLQRETYVAEP